GPPLSGPPLSGPPLSGPPLSGPPAPQALPFREVTLALASVNVAATTPLEALNLLFSLQRQALAALRASYTMETEGASR
ncbi:MAG: hypothetical protein IVW57_05395, partial [Ktedonobacterales bacterium]|nr:hypothetical protein [Ktedonobacterales bacterium]